MKYNISDDPELDKLLKVDTLSLEQEVNTSTAVADYLSRTGPRRKERLKDIKDNFSIKINKNLYKKSKLTLNKYSVDEFHDLINHKNNKINPAIKFPRIKDFNKLFWFFHNILTPEMHNKKIYFDYNENSDFSKEAINALCFFDYFKYVSIDGENFYIITDQTKKFITLNLNERYLQFVVDATKNDTVRSAITGQLFVVIYDNITKGVIKRRLLQDPNIIEENVSGNDLNKIIDNFRFWFLNIKKNLLK